MQLSFSFQSSPPEPIHQSLAAPSVLGGTHPALPPLFSAPVGAWVHLHKRRYFVAYLTCGAATRQSVLSSERRV